MKLDKPKLTKILSISIGVLLAGVLIFVGFKLLQGVFTKASDTAPRDVIITGSTQSASHIGWTTDQETQGVIEYGSSPTSLNFFAPEAQKGKKHSVDITLLSPGTTYYFQIRVGDQKYDNGGVPWTFVTKAKGAATDATPTATPTATVVPTPVVTAGALIRPTTSLSFKLPPTPIPLPTLSSFVCGETSCITICQKLNRTCSSREWMTSGCVGKVNPLTCVQIVPTNTPAPTATGAPTATLTPQATATPTTILTSTPTATPSATTAP
ncbi:fibronectin type III domain-containing protein [Candidatus Roizmanbacteria bacterium]|nr:fibronectin type III domain-containing protein [Candidatus Roizmanbacteria bacterium]